MKRPSSDQENASSVENVLTHYDKDEASSNPSSQMKVGEIAELLGSNGAAETTAIRVLSTIIAPTTGRFSIRWIPNSRQEGIRRLIGVLPVGSGFPLAMTGGHASLCKGPGDGYHFA